MSEHVLLVNGPADCTRMVVPNTKGHIEMAVFAPLSAGLNYRIVGHTPEMYKTARYERVAQLVGTSTDPAVTIYEYRETR